MSTFSLATAVALPLPCEKNTPTLRQVTKLVLKDSLESRILAMQEEGGSASSARRWVGVGDPPLAVEITCFSPSGLPACATPFDVLAELRVALNLNAATVEARRYSIR